MRHSPSVFHISPLFFYLPTRLPSCFFFFFNNPAPPEIYPLPLHAALPISRMRAGPSSLWLPLPGPPCGRFHAIGRMFGPRLWPIFPPTCPHPPGSTPPAAPPSRVSSLRP